MKPFQADDAIGFPTSRAIYPYTGFATWKAIGRSL